MKRPGDIQGLIDVPFKSDASEAAFLLAKELRGKGIQIDLKRIQLRVK